MTVLKMLGDCFMGELAAVRQYTSHAAEQKIGGYTKLANHSREEALEELGHANRFAERIVFLGGKIPDTTVVAQSSVSSNIKEQLGSDLDLERGAIARLTEAVNVATNDNDFVTRVLFESILSDEEGHQLWLEQQLGLIESVGLQNYLTLQV